MSTDPVALDGVACRIMNLDPELVPTMVAAADRLGEYRGVRLLGDRIDDCICRISRLTGNRTWIPFTGCLLMRRHMIPRPVIRQNAVPVAAPALRCALSRPRPSISAGRPHHPPNMITTCASGVIAAWYLSRQRHRSGNALARTSDS